MSKGQRRSPDRPSAPPSRRQRIREEMMPEHSDELPEAPQHHQDDDGETVAPEPSIETIIKRIRARSEGSSGDAQNGAGSPPFARSKNLQTIGKPSFLPSQTVDSSVCYTKLLHNGDRRLGAKPLNGRDNRQNFCYTILLHNSRGGLVRRAGWFHYRRRVPDALRTVFGRSEGKERSGSAMATKLSKGGRLKRGSHAFSPMTSRVIEKTSGSTPLHTNFGG